MSKQRFACKLGGLSYSKVIIFHLFGSRELLVDANDQTTFTERSQIHAENTVSLQQPHRRLPSCEYTVNCKELHKSAPKGQHKFQQWPTAMEDHCTHFTGIEATHPLFLHISNVTAGMTKNCPSFGSSTALAKSTPFWLEVWELILDIWRNSRMAAGEGLSCPNGKAQKTLYNEVVNVSS